jgi:Pentapeptide repeats (8 copies)/PDZ domain
LSNLTFADLAHANLESADLRDTDLIFANLEDAKLADANFSGARLHGVDLSGANLKKARNLTQVQIDQAGAGGTGTKLPEGIEPPNWWSYRNATVEPPEKNSLAYPRLQDHEPHGDHESRAVHRLGASLVPLKSAKTSVRSEIGIPNDVGISEHGASGALVYDVQPRSLANAAGLQPGDIIVTMGGKKPRGLEDLKGKLHRHLDKETGSQVQFAIRRWFFEKGWRKGVVDANIGDQ